MSLAGEYCRTLGERFGQAWNRFWFTPVDPLPLAVLRIAVGGAALFLVASFSPDLLRYFGPQGMFPLVTIESLYPNNVRPSYLNYITDPTTLQAVHGVGLAILAAFTLGLWTRVTNVLSLVVFLSYFHRALVITHIGEPVVVMMLFYLCFGPSGARLSIDAWWRGRNGSDKTSRRNSPAAGGAHFSANLSLRLIQVHLVLIYFMMFCATLQRNETWWRGEAVWWLIARPDACLLDLRWLHQFPYVVNLWTMFIVAFELAFALLIWNAVARPLMLALSVPMWAGLAILTGNVPFCFAMFAGGLAFVSADQWRALAVAPERKLATA